MLKKDQNDALVAIEKLLLSGAIKNEKEIIMIMISENISISQLLAKEMGRIESPRRKFFKGICELTGYSFDELPIAAAQRARAREKYPDICKGCSTRLKTWEEKFQKIKMEISAQKLKVAAF